MKIAIVGSGVSGLVCGYLLHPHHDVTLFEGAQRIGGHIHTVPIEIEGRSHAIDTGFIVFNDRNYPNFVRLLDELEVPSHPTSMSFSVRCERCGLEYCGSSLGGLFAQKRNLVSASFRRMLKDIWRFNREAPAVLDVIPDDLTVGRFLHDRRYSRDFADHYLLPMGAAIWSCPMTRFAEFPIRFIIEFYQHHGLLQLRDRPVWRVVSKGSQTYVDALIAGFRNRIRTGCSVVDVSRSDSDVTVRTSAGTESFDEVVFACHADQSLALLAAPTASECSVLSAFPYGENHAVLHTDTRLLPRRRRAWASWNYHVRRDAQVRPSVTYHMNTLQRIDSPQSLCVTLNESDSIDAQLILREFRYRHPVFTTRRTAAQQRHSDLIRHNRTSFAGAYWGNGFHEDGVVSALRVCRAFGITPPWRNEMAMLPANAVRLPAEFACAE